MTRCVSAHGLLSLRHIHHLQIRLDARNASVFVVDRGVNVNPIRAVYPLLPTGLAVNLRLCLRMTWGICLLMLNRPGATK